MFKKYFCLKLQKKSRIMLNQKIINFVRETLRHSEGGHDYWHAIRVLNNVNIICEDYPNINLLALQTAALLHDIIDHKFNNFDSTYLISFLRSIEFDDSDIDFVIKLIENVSFSSENKNNFQAIELDILQDADRLDAIGAIGIARAFSYGAYKKREFYNPQIKPNLKMTKEEYRNSNSTTINHFYEKLLLLKDQMKTQKAKEIAKQRHDFMLNYLEQFFIECELENENNY